MTSYGLGYAAQFHCISNVKWSEQREKERERKEPPAERREKDEANGGNFFYNNRADGKIFGFGVFASRTVHNPAPPAVTFPRRKVKNGEEEEEKIIFFFFPLSENELNSTSK